MSLPPSEKPSDASNEPQADLSPGPELGPGVRCLKLTIEYDGTSFHGWQIQPGCRTVEGVIEDVLRGLEDSDVDLHGASRTDQGVHAHGQAASFLSKSRIPTERYARALNGRLPSDVRIVRVEEAPLGFHARFSAVGKRYRYWIDSSESSSVFLSRYTLHVPERLDLEALRAGAAHFVGEHDFASYRCESGAPLESTVRTIHSVVIDVNEDLISIDVWGTSFLYKMVRTMAGTLLEVGRGRWESARVAESLRARDRKAAGPTAPGHALCLMTVYYEPLAIEQAVREGTEGGLSRGGQLRRWF